MELTRQQKLTYGIVGILAVLLLGILGYTQALQLRGGSSSVAPPPAAIGGLRASEAAQELDTDVLHDPRYQSLDQSLLDGGRIPVPAPAVRGRPNLF